jgi:hypothetical protein
VSGHGVSADHEKIIGPMVLRPASPNGHRQCAPAVITEDGSDSIGSPRLPARTNPPDPAENNWDAERPAPTREASTPRLPARPLGSGIRGDRT